MIAYIHPHLPPYTNLWVQVYFIFQSFKHDKHSVPMLNEKMDQCFVNDKELQKKKKKPKIVIVWP